MSGRRVAAIARRIAEQFRRDRPTLGLVFVAPIVILALLGWVLRDQHPPTTRLGIVNLAGAQGQVAAQGLATAAGGAGVMLVDAGSGPSAADDAVRSDRADVVVVLPAAFAPSQPGSAPIEVVTSGLSPGEDAARIGELQRIVASQLPAGGIQISRRTVYGGGSNDALDTFAPALLG